MRLRALSGVRMLPGKQSALGRRLFAGLLASLSLDPATAASPVRAMSSDAASIRPAGAVDFDRIYREALPSVFVVETASWVGPGVLADASGLVLAPFLGLSQGSYAAVTAAPGRKVRAEVLEARGSTCTILRVSPEAVAGLAPLPMAESGDEGSLPAAGDRLLGIFWSKGNGFTRRTGTIGKVTRGEYRTDLTLPDSPGSGAARTACSGGLPLPCADGIILDAGGRLVGLRMARKSGRRPQTLITRLKGIQDLLDHARAEEAKRAPPSPLPLPVAPEIPYPEEALERLSREVDPAHYRVQAGPYLVEFQTPLVARAEALNKGTPESAGSADVCSEPKGTVNRWRPGFADETPVVTVLVVPEIHRNAGTYVGVTAYWVFIPVIFVASLLSGSNLFAAPPPHVSSRFDPAVQEIELVRGGRRLEPIHPGRTCGTSAPLEIDFCPPGSPEERTRRVKGCYLAYEYLADDFVPGEPMELRILPQDRDDALTVLPLEERLRDRIWSDFGPYREMTESR